MKRRDFVATGIAASAAASAATTPPVRSAPLRASYWGTQFYGAEEKAELLDVLDTQSPFRWYGPKTPTKVAQLETEFAARMGAKYALAVTSGTAALQCAMAAFEIGPGDEVILPAWTWHSCCNAVILAGALPVFAEIDHTFNIDPDSLEKLITPQTKLIMAVHLQGNPCHLDRVLSIARKHNIRVLEDCAQSVGASYKGKPLGSMGDIGIFSLQLNKTITAGEGGALVTNDARLFERAARFHDLGGYRAPHQQRTEGAHLDWFIGTNFRMNEFSGGVLLAQLRKLDRIIAAVRANAKHVYNGVRDLPGIRFRDLPDPAGELGTGVFIDFATKARADRFLDLMKTENVPGAKPGGSVILPTLPHIMAKKAHPQWPSFTLGRGRTIEYGPQSCPRTIDILGRYAGVLIDPKFTRRDTDDIVAAIRKVYPQV